ncbi:F-box domain, FBD domain, Leucine-rich repeat domain, L domain-like protein [Artemisia annua]|uniref:F-box domain, FBD domain, Leucine-rich repeat domain, L domain-like protein n=1 Tax=Artemisia annua TaxID=35608 RepID=A0A2U1NCY4_ARTAN|nr:F-box domain, FBD domain, Leucine-rich repeat domain, L domain-like protein [Artemisia annua]
MKKSKPSKRPKRVDFISNMPDPILQSILQRLPTTEEIARTSVLSTRWRYLWTSIPSIDLDISRATAFDKKIFKKFVTRALENNTLDLDSFRLSCAGYCSMSTVSRWINAAVTRNVKVLDLSFGPSDEDDVVELPECLIACDSLESLRLFLMARTLILSNVGFSKLKVLELNLVELIDEDSVKAFFENCLLLEELNLFDCLLNKLETLCISNQSLRILRIDNRNLDYTEDPPADYDLKSNMIYYDNEGLCNSLELCCPELVYFEYGGHIAYNFDFENMDSLKVVEIHPEDMSQVDLSFESLGDTICELFAGISHVEALSINLYFVQAISAAHDPEGHFPTSLPNMKTLEISTTIDDYTMQAVMRILRCSPNLESLRLIILKEIFWPQCWELDEVLTHHLTRVEFIDFNGEERKLAMARFILEHANALNVMVFIWRDKVKYDEKSMETMNQVSTFHKASSTVKVFTLLKEQPFEPPYKLK